MIMDLFEGDLGNVWGHQDGLGGVCAKCGGDLAADSTAR